MATRSLHFVISGDGKGLISAVGASVSEIEKLNKAAERMAEKLGKADAGAKAMVVLEAAVKKLGGTSQLTGEQLSMVKERLERLSSIGAKIPDEFAKLKASMDSAAAASRALGAAQGELTGRAQGLASSMGPLGGVLGAIGPAGLAAAAGIGAVVAVVGTVAGVIDAAVSKAMAFGSTFQQMSDNSEVAARTLQGIAGAAGVGMEGVQSFTAGLKKLNVELLQGDAPAKFGQLGLSVKDLLAMKPEDRFAATARAILELSTDADRAAASQDLLGKAMPLATLKDFADIQEKISRSEGLGLTLDDNTTAQLKALSDEASVLANTWDHLMINLGATIATTPGVQEGLTGVTDAVGELNTFLKDNADTIQGVVTGALNVGATAFGLLAAAIQDALNKFNALRALADNLPGNGKGAGSAALAVMGNASFPGLGTALFGPAAGPSGPGGMMSFGGKKLFTEPSAPATGGKHYDPAAASKAKQAAAEAARAAKEAEALQEKLQKRSLDMAASMDEARAKYEEVWTSIAGLSSEQVGAELEKIGTLFTDQIKGGAEVSTAQLEKLRLKMLELAKQSPEAFERAFDSNAGVAGIMSASAGMGGNFGPGIDRSDLDLRGEREKAEAAEHLRRNLESVSQSLVRFGGSIGGFAGGLAKLAGGIAGAFTSANFGSALAKKGGTNSDKAAAGVSALGAAGDIYQQNKHNMSAMGGMGSGAASGAKAGAAFGPYGVVIGAVAGGLIGLFSGSGFRKMAKEAGKTLGVEVTKELAEAIEATKKKLQVGTKEASLLNISGAMGDKDPRTFGKQVNELLDGIAAGSIPAKEGLEELAKDFGAIADAALKAGSVGDKAMVGIIKRSRELGVESPEIKAFVQQQLAGAAGGVGKFVGSFKDEKLSGGLDLFAGAANWRDGLQMAEASGKAQATIFSTVFWAQVKELGIVGAVDSMQEPFERLKENLSTVFGGDQISAIFGGVEAMFGLANNELFRGASEGALGLKEALEGVANAGYLTNDSFSAFQQQAKAAFEQAVAGGATSVQAFQAIGPLLQSLMSASGNYGINLDDATKAMIEQAKAAGVAFKTDPLDRMAEATDRMVVALEKLAGITPRVADGLRNIGSAADGINVGGGGYPSPAGGDGIPGMASGGYVPPRPGGTIVRLGEAGRGETVIPDGSVGARGVSFTYAPSLVVNGAGNEGEIKAVVMEALRNDANGILGRVQEIVAAGA